MQNETSDANWSFLNKKFEPEQNLKFDFQKSKTSRNQQNIWKNYAVVLVILGFITLIAINNNHNTAVEPDLVVLNQVIDLIDESSYIKTLQLKEANFSMDKVNVIMRSEDFTSIRSLSQDYRIENKIPYEMYQKGKFSYLDLIFPWKGNDKGGDITILKSLADKTVFSRNISINTTEDIFEIQGDASDIISFLLKMVENNQIQKYNFSVFHQDLGKFVIKVQPHLL